MFKRVFVFLLSLALVAVAHADGDRVALLISSNGSATNADLSYDLEELAQAYLVLHGNGLKLDIVSPKGGAVFVKNNKDNLEYIQNFKSLALGKLQNTISSKLARENTYDAVFIVGGGGAMIDLPRDRDTQLFLKKFVDEELPIAAVCHGPAALADIKHDSGEYFVKGKTVNGFTNVEENAFSKESIEKFPFLLQDKLEANGGNFVHNAPMLPYVAVDGNLITAQNPSSVASAADILVSKLGRDVNKRDLFKDEATMKLISRARSEGAILVDFALSQDSERYDMNYLALYGFYAYDLAEEEDKEKELQLMGSIASHFRHPVYEKKWITVLAAERQFAKANRVFEAFIDQYPDHEDIDELALLLKNRP